MSAAVLVLPQVWASVPLLAEAAEAEEQRPLAPGVAFYRKYTEAMLRRYVAMSMEAGRVPSLLGKEMFRAKVTSYAVQSFADVVIFVHDVEKCVAKLDWEQQMYIRRIAVQQYTQGEMAAMMGLSLRTVLRRYTDALDRLTRIFLEVGLMDPRTECQGVGSGRKLVSVSMEMS
jgi:predicted DNA-binding protein (UPF0251 family)